MRRYKYIGHDGSSGYRAGKHYWGYRVKTRSTGRIWFMPLNTKRKEVGYTDYERFKADWE